MDAFSNNRCLHFGVYPLLHWMVGTTLNRAKGCHEDSCDLKATNGHYTFTSSDVSENISTLWQASIVRQWWDLLAKSRVLTERTKSCDLTAALATIYKTAHTIPGDERFLERKWSLYKMIIRELRSAQLANSRCWTAE
eukprot:TRINITY_DN17937_c0_g1_i1.p1 TRINITY_DN17937_c0_g1~~TRINITY_DN17937_c0_g1_i1.p1  ORF type:complete len:138 (-),score=2.09 TRINITY_DN17937_c0_g1_i1:76-489(-)